jgi:uncharacterized protein YdaU (DUF1376 family)
MRANYTAAGPGHNSEAFGQTLLREELEAALGGDEKVVFHYVKLHIGDYLAGTKEMGLEQEGAYSRFLMNLYERGKPFPDDDRLMARVMRLSLRVWKRIRDGLIALGKIVAKNGCLTNARFEKERQKRAEEMRQKALAANTRWSKTPASSGKTLAKLDANLVETSAKLAANIVKKANEINETPENVHIVSRIQNPESIKKEEESPATRLTDSQLGAMLERAAGACLENPAACPGLLVLSTPRRWLEQGCDLHTDVLPVLKQVGSTRPMRSVRDWNYFTRAIVEAKAKRKVALPTADNEAIAEAKFREREKMIRQRAAILGISTDEYRERMQKAKA